MRLVNHLSALGRLSRARNPPSQHLGCSTSPTRMDIVKMQFDFPLFICIWEPNPPKLMN